MFRPMLRATTLAAPLLGGLFAAAPAHAQVYECPPLSNECYDPEERIPAGASIQVTQTGFDAIGDAAVAVLPSLLDELAGSLPSELDEGEPDGVGGIRISPLQLVITPTDLEFVTKPTGNKATIEATIFADLDANDASEPYNLKVSALWIPICDGTGYFSASATIKVNIEITFRAGQAPDINVVLPNTFLDLPSFSASGECSGVAQFASQLIPGLQGLLRPTLQNLLNDVLGDLGDSLDAILINEEVELLGKTLTIDLSPQRSYSTANGIDLVLGGSFGGGPDLCIADVDPGGSFRTDTNPISVDDNAAGTQVAVRAADDFVNAAAYAAFRAGLLCITVDEELLGDTSLPIPIDSTLVPLVTGSYGDEYKKILPPESDPQELVILTRPREVPRLVLDGPNDINLAVRNLEVGLFTELEGRMARAVALGVNADAGVDLLFDDQTGELLIDLDLDNDLVLDIKAIPDVLVSGAGPEIESGINNLIGTLLPTLLGDTLEGLGFAIPSFEGVGLQSIDVRADGPQGDWLLIDAAVGEVTYAGGCGGDSGGDSGCGGCANGGMSPLGAGMLLLTPVVLLRRRTR